MEIEDTIIGFQVDPFDTHLATSQPCRAGAFYPRATSFVWCERV
jgi:hypothetical protein